MQSFICIIGFFDAFSAAEASSIDMWGIAIVHTLFNVLNAIAFAPFTRLLERLVRLTVRGNDEDGVVVE